MAAKDGGGISQRGRSDAYSDIGADADTYGDDDAGHVVHADCDADG